MCNFICKFWQYSSFYFLDLWVLLLCSYNNSFVIILQHYSISCNIYHYSWHPQFAINHLCHFYGIIKIEPIICSIFWLYTCYLDLLRPLLLNLNQYIQIFTDILYDSYFPDLVSILSSPGFKSFLLIFTKTGAYSLPNSYILLFCTLSHSVLLLRFHNRVLIT